MALLCGSVPTIWKSNSQHLHVHVQVLILADKWGCMPPIKVLEKSFDPIDMSYMCVLVWIGVPIIYIERYFNYSCRSLFFRCHFVSSRFLCLSLRDTWDDWGVEQEGRPMFCNFICFIEQSTLNEILPLSKSVPKLPPISVRPEFQAQVKRSSQVLKGKHLLKQESSLIVGSNAQTRQSKTQQMRLKTEWTFTCHSLKYAGYGQCPGPEYVVIPEFLEKCFWNMEIYVNWKHEWPWRSPLPPSGTWPPQPLTSCSLALAVTALCWTCPQRLPGDWFLLHCGILCRNLSYFTFPSMPGNCGHVEGSISASLDRPSLFWLKAPLQHLVLEVLLLLTTVPQEPAELIPWETCALWDLFPASSSCQLLPGACLESGTESFTWEEELSQTPRPGAGQNWNLKILLGDLLYFPVS